MSLSYIWKPSLDPDAQPKLCGICRDVNHHSVTRHSTLKRYDGIALNLLSRKIEFPANLNASIEDGDSCPSL